MAKTTEVKETKGTPDTAEATAAAWGADTSHPSGGANVSGLVYLAIPPGELDAIRAAGRDEAGNPLDVQVHRDGGAPLRCCLREARAGERLLLIAYTPP